MLSGAIVGFGNVAQLGHWPAYQNNPDARIVAVVDARPERRAIANELSLESFERLGQLGGIDFVDICTPPANHAQQIIEAARNGWPVLCEKPLVINSAQLREISGVDVAVVPVHNWKYAPIIRRATELLRADVIGQLRRAQIRVGRTQPAASTASSWRGNAELAGGGIVMDHGWHAIYLALGWFGESARDVHAQLVRSDAAETEASVIIAFDSGSAEISLSWNAAIRENRIKLVGDRGQIVIDDDVLRVNGNAEQFDQKLSAGSHHPDWFAAMLPDVLAMFRHPARSHPLLREAAECLRIIEQAYASA